MIVFKFIIVAAVSYLLGSLNFGVILSKFKKDDVRKHGSGNAGTTNMLRNFGKVFAVLTIIGDMLKVAVAIWLALVIVPDDYLMKYSFFSEYTEDVVQIMVMSWAGLFCVLGHIYPCFFKFRGGKGVATCGGMVFLIDYRIALILLAMFVITVAITRYVSLGSLLMAAFYPIYTLAFYLNVPLFIIALIFSAIVIIKHSENISRLLAHTESKISFSKKK